MACVSIAGTQNGEFVIKWPVILTHAYVHTYTCQLGDSDREFA